MHLRRTLTLATAALVLPFALSACTGDATSKINTNAASVLNRDADVDVLGAVVVSAQEGSGTFIASFSNNSTTEDNAVTALEGVDANQLTVDGDVSIDVPARGFVNLAQDDQGIAVSGDFAAGDFVKVAVQFEDGSRVQLEIPVVTSCGQYEGLDGTEECDAPETLDAEG